MSFGRALKGFTSGFQVGFSLGEKGEERKLRERMYNARIKGMTTDAVGRESELREKGLAGSDDPTLGTAREPSANVTAPEEIAALINQHVPEEMRDYMTRLVGKESSFNPDAVSPTGAKGLAQFTRQTGADYGLFGQQGDMRADPTLNLQAAVKFTMDNREKLRQALGREPTWGETALAHQQGAGGAIALLSGKPVPGKNLAVNNVNPNTDPMVAARKIMAYYDMPTAGKTFAAAATKTPKRAAATAIPTRTTIPADEDEDDYVEGGEEDEDEGENLATGGSVGRVFTQQIAADPARPASGGWTPRKVGQAPATPTAIPTGGLQQKFRDLLAKQAAQKPVAAPTGPVFDPKASLSAYQTAKNNWDLNQSRQMARQNTLAGLHRDKGDPLGGMPAYQAGPRKQFMTEQQFMQIQPGYADWHQKQYGQPYVRPTGRAGNLTALQRGWQATHPAPPPSMGFAEGGLVSPTDYDELDPGGGPIREETAALWRLDAQAAQRARQRLEKRDAQYHGAQPPRDPRDAGGGGGGKKTRKRKAAAPDDYLDETQHPKIGDEEEITGPAPGTPGAGKPGELGTALPTGQPPRMVGKGVPGWLPGEVPLGKGLNLPAPPSDLVSDPMGAAVPGQEVEYAPYGSPPGAPSPPPNPPVAVEGRGERPAENIKWIPISPTGEPLAPARTYDEIAQVPFGATSPAAPAAPPGPGAPPIEGRGERPGENIKWIPVDPTGKPVAPPQAAPTEIAPPGEIRPPTAPGTPLGRTAIPARGGPAQPLMPPRSATPPPDNSDAALPARPGLTSPPNAIQPPGEIRPPGYPPETAGPPKTLAGNDIDMGEEPWIPQNVPENAVGTLSQAWAAGRAMVNTGTQSAEPRQRFYKLLEAARAAGVPNSVIAAYAENFGVPPPKRGTAIPSFAEGGLVEEEEEGIAPLPVLPEGRRNAARADVEAQDRAVGRGRALVTPEETRESTAAGMKWINDRLLSPQRTTAIGDDPAQGDAQQKFDTNDHALTNEEVKALTAKVDPENRLGKAEKIMKLQQDMFDFYTAEGYPEKAAAAAASVLMYGRRVSQQSGLMAQAALEAGDLATAGQWMAKAYETLPDGKELRIGQQVQNGGLPYQIVDLDTGETEMEGVATAEDMMGMATSMSSGIQWAKEAQRIATGTGLTGSTKRGGSKTADKAERNAALQALNEAGKAFEADPSEENRAAYEEAETAAFGASVQQGAANTIRKRYGLDPVKVTEGERKRQDAAAEEEAHTGKLGKLDAAIAAAGDDQAKADKAQEAKDNYLMDRAFNAQIKQNRKRVVETGEVSQALLDLGGEIDPVDAQLIKRNANDFMRANGVDGAGAVDALKSFLDPAMPLEVQDDGTVSAGGAGGVFLNPRMLGDIIKLRRSRKAQAAGG